MKQVMELDPTTTSGVPPKPMDLHVLDRRPWTPGVAADPNTPPQPAERTLCGLPWDRLDPKRNGPLCKECERIVRARGHGHLLPSIGRAP